MWIDQDYILYCPHLRFKGYLDQSCVAIVATANDAQLSAFLPIFNAMFLESPYASKKQSKRQTLNAVSSNLDLLRTSCLHFAIAHRIFELQQLHHRNRMRRSPTDLVLVARRASSPPARERGVEVPDQESDCP